MNNKKFLKMFILTIGLILFSPVLVSANLPAKTGELNYVALDGMQDGSIGSRQETAKKRLVSYECAAGSKCYDIGINEGTLNNEPMVFLCTKTRLDSPLYMTGTRICNITDDWTDQIRYSVAAVISASKNKIMNDNNKAEAQYGGYKINDDYVAAQLAINQFLLDKGVGTVDANEVYTDRMISAQQTLYVNYLGIANNAFSQFDSVKNAISLSSDTLSFTETDTHYVSNEITVSGTSDYTVNASFGNVVKSGNKFHIEVSLTDITESRSITVTVTDNSKMNYARNYSCASNIQTITPMALEEKPKSIQRQLSGTIDPSVKLTINKHDSKGKPLKGATIKITRKNSDYSYQFVTDGSPKVIDNLEYGEYTIEEISAPAGYSIAKKQTVTLSNTKHFEIITLTDELTKVKITKFDVTGKRELPGATLEVQDEEGNIVKYCTDKNNNKNSECKWVSEDKPYEIEGLPIGKYYLVETIAPEGYEINEEKVLFEVKGDGKVVEVKMENELKVKVPDTLSSRSAFLITIAMFDIALGIGIITYVKKNKVEE